MATDAPAPQTQDDAGRRREQRSWYWYDWANSAYVTTTLTVLIGPWLTVVAKRAACPGLPSDAECTTPLHVLGVPIAPGSLALYTITTATLLSAVLLPILGAVVDRVGRKRTLLGYFAWFGALAGAAMVTIGGDRWQLGVALELVATLAYAGSLVIYDSILIDISTPDERDAVSSRGWALGYLGGGLLLALNLGMVQGHAAFGISEEWAVRLSLLSAGVWWAAFTLILWAGLRDRPPLAREPVEGGFVLSAFGQLWRTLKHLRGYPQTMLFLLAYLFISDGIQTVIFASSIYGQEELHLPRAALISTILLIQFVGVVGSLAFGRLAARIGARRTVLLSLVLWCVVVAIGFFLPERQAGLFLAVGALIGIVLGGSQALARSLFSQLVPRGREAEYFSLYQATERGTSWFGTLLFGLVYQLTGSYRQAIIALLAFFVIGGTLLWRVRMREGIVAAGNAVPDVV
jgi:MFS transporter, UMF1 family